MAARSSSPGAASYASGQTAGASTSSCAASGGANATPQPCNLDYLQLTRVDDGACTRDVRYKDGVTPSYNVTPVVLAPSTPFQIVAPSRHGQNVATEVGVTVFTEATCSAGIHPILVSSDSIGDQVDLASSRPLRYFRDRVAGDALPAPDFLMLLRMAFGRVSRTYRVEATACGIPVDDDGVASYNLRALVEVFPADSFKLTLKIPALISPERFNAVAKRQTENWKSDTQRRVDAAGAVGAQAYDQDAAARANDPAVVLPFDSRRQYRQFAEELQQKQIEREKADELALFRKANGLPAEPEKPGALAQKLSELEIELTTTDGTRERTANPESIIKLIRMIRSAEYAFKQISEWIDGLQVGWGASIKVECQFLVLSVSGEWGYKESPADQRVFMGMRGELKCDVMKVTVDITAGWRAGGAADLYVQLSGTGTLSLAASVERMDIGQPLRKRITPKGKVALEGKLVGEVGWTVKMKGSITVDFSTDVSGLHVFTEAGFLGGELTIQRSAVTASFTASFAGIWEDTDSAELVKGNNRCHVFTFG